MSIVYPVPSPLRVVVLARPPVAQTDRTMYLPAAPAAGVELPSLVVAPMMPPQGPRL